MFSSDELAGAVLLPSSSGAQPTFSTSYAFDPADTKDFGIRVTVSNSNHPVTRYNDETNKQQLMMLVSSQSSTFPPIL